MQEIITKTDLCKLLDITPRVAQRELEKALLIENSGVFKFGKSYRILKDKYIDYLLTKDKVRKCEKENLKVLSKEAINTTLTTMTNKQSKESPPLLLAGCFLAALLGRFAMRLCARAESYIGGKQYHHQRGTPAGGATDPHVCGL